MAELTIKQRKFADEYIISGNATEAAIKAGYKEPSAKVTACRLLTNANLKAYIEERMQSHQKESIMSAEEVLEFLTAVARDKNQDVKDRIKCAELMGKRYAVFTDKVEADATIQVEMGGLDAYSD